MVFSGTSGVSFLSWDPSPFFLPETSSEACFDRCGINLRVLAENVPQRREFVPCMGVLLADGLGVLPFLGGGGFEWLSGGHHDADLEFVDELFHSAFGYADLTSDIVQFW